MTCMYDMEPPKAQPSAPKAAKNGTRSRQSTRTDMRQTANAARQPGILAPYSWPKFPRIPHPMDSESPTSSKVDGLRTGRSLAAYMVSRSVGLRTARCSQGGKAQERCHEQHDCTIRQRAGIS